MQSLFNEEELPRACEQVRTAACACRSLSETSSLRPHWVLGTKPMAGLHGKPFTHEPACWPQTLPCFSPQSSLCTPRVPPPCSSFAPLSARSWRFCTTHSSPLPLTQRLLRAGVAPGRGSVSAKQGKLGRYSLSAGTPSSLFSCFYTWQLRFCFFPAASFSFRLLQGPPIKPKRHMFKPP